VPQPAQGGLGEVFDVRERIGKSGIRRCRESSLLLLGRVRIPPAPGYSLFTAADEKIPLPVVQVNNKPQYLVFQTQIRHPSPKHRHLPVES
jgi:hypothetical protein